jgi:hypothetical protein
VKRVLRHIYRHLFLYVFLLVQALFIVWIIGGAQSAHCDAQGSQLDNSACTAGAGIAIGLIIGLWVAADVILGVGRLVVVTTRKHSSK